MEAGCVVGEGCAAARFAPPEIRFCAQTKEMISTVLRNTTVKLCGLSHGSSQSEQLTQDSRTDGLATFALWPDKCGIGIPFGLLPIIGCRLMGKITR